MNPFGLCWHSGFWTQDQAVAPCDAVPQAAPPAAPQAFVAPEPKAVPAPAPVTVQVAAPAPVPAPAPVVVQPTYEKVTLSADVLFDFNKATLKDAGKQKLDELADRLRGASLDQISIVGFADRIGSAKYNQRISEERAKAVKAYLASRTDARSIQTAGKGKVQPVTGNRCNGLGKESGTNKRLVECLQADRRVEIELFGVRTARQGSSSGAGVQPTSFTGNR